MHFSWIYAHIIETTSKNMEPLKNISLSELIESIQSKFEICGVEPDDQDEAMYSRRTLWVVALDAIEFAIQSTVEYYDEFQPIDKPDCEHITDFLDTDRLKSVSLADDNDDGSEGVF